MKKLTVALVLVALLTLPTMGLAGPPANPPQGNDGLCNAVGILLALGMATGNCWIALGFLDDLLSYGAPPTWWP